VDTLLAVAEEARYLSDPDQENFCVWALLDARMDEMYASRYVFGQGAWTQTHDHVLLSPNQLLCEPEDAIAGNVLAPYGARLNIDLAHYVDALPSAAALLRLAPALLAAGGAMPADQALPLYVRDKVAKTTAERAAEKAAL
jgi:tRNA threonylcarbamoyladenosine biosynthesis protein TsaB